jgi:hypothetical protein
VITEPSEVASFPAVMDVHSSGYSDGEYGSVWAIERIKNPRKVMDKVSLENLVILFIGADFY